MSLGRGMGMLAAVIVGLACSLPTWAQDASTDDDSRIDRALGWLSRHQMKDGRWSASEFAERCQHAEEEAACDGAGTLDDLTTTSLVLWTYLGAGETHVEGDHTETVISSLKWISKQQRKDGRFGATEAAGGLRRHVVATRSLVELYGLTGSSTAKKRAALAIEFMVSLQRSSGAWGEGGDDAADTGEVLFVLRLARMAELPVDAAVIERGLAWLGKRTNEESGAFDAGTARDPFGEPAGTAATAQALLARLWLVDVESARKDATLDRSAGRLFDDLVPFPDDAADANFYGWEMASHALRQIGGERWRRWKSRMLPAIQSGQETKSCALGSFPPVDATAKQGGRVIATALVCSTEQSCYRYARVLDAKK